MAYLSFEPQYEATAWIQIKDRAPYIAFEAEADDSKVFVATQIELLRSPMVVRPVSDQPGVATLPDVLERDDPLEWLRNQIKVKRIGDSDLYTVTFACSRPREAARIVNSILDSYFVQLKEKRDQRSVGLSELLRAEQEALEQQVYVLRKSVREMAQRVTGPDLFKDGSEPSAVKTKPLASLVSHARELQGGEQSTDDSISLRFEQDKLALKEWVLEAISKRIVILSTERNAPERVVRYQDAEVPLVPTQRAPYLKLAIAIACGFLTPFGLALLSSRLPRLTESADQKAQAAVATSNETDL